MLYIFHVADEAISGTAEAIAAAEGCYTGFCKFPRHAKILWSLLWKLSSQDFWSCDLQTSDSLGVCFLLFQ